MCQRNIGKTNRDHSFDIKYNTKIEKILKGSLDLIQSPSSSMIIQIMGGRDCLLGIVNTLLKTTIARQ